MVELGYKTGGSRTLIEILFSISVFVLILKLILPVIIRNIRSIQNQECISDIYTQNDVIIIFFFTFNLSICAIYFLLFDYKYTIRDIIALNTEVCENFFSDNRSISITQDQNERKKIILKTLKGNDCKVIEMLSKFSELNQTELGLRANIPKATLSRTISDLEKRGLIIRYKNGMSKMVKLSDDLQEMNNLQIIDQKDNLNIQYDNNLCIQQ